MIFSDETLIRGKKLVNKLWNMASFINMHLEDYKEQEFTDFEYMDKWIISKFIQMEKQFKNYLEDYEVGLALNHLERFFWNFCDNYIEIVKNRLYKPEDFGEKARLSGQKTCYMLLYKILQDFSIFFPFVTEEIYQNMFCKEKSIHLTKMEELNYNFSDIENLGDMIVEIISSARGVKTIKNVSLKTPINLMEINVSEKLDKAIDESIKDFIATLTIVKLKKNVTKIDTFEVKIIELG
jgi:valyl-tRNA synthetase